MANELSRLCFEIIYLSSKGAQIIVIDDGSDDETFTLLQKFTFKYGLQKSLKLISQNHSGPGVARNVACLEAINDIIVFWDSDDIRDLEMLEEINLDFAEDMLVAQFVPKYVNKSGRIMQNLQTKNLLDLSVNGGVWRIFFQRNFISGIKFPNLFCGEDLVFLADVLDKNPRIIWSKSTIYEYNNWQNGQISTNIFYKKDSLQACLILINKLKNPKTKNKKYIGILLLKLLNTAMKSDWKKLFISSTMSLFKGGIISCLRVISILIRSLLAFASQKIIIRIRL